MAPEPEEETLEFVFQAYNRQGVTLTDYLP